MGVFLLLSRLFGRCARTVVRVAFPFFWSFFMAKYSPNRRKSAGQFNRRADRTDRRNLVVVRRGGYRL